ncbi:MAG: hypothetical protein AAB456_00540 [Patescibacteria group bacterium]
MKIFTFIIFIWFLIQLLIISSASVKNGLNEARGNWECEYQDLKETEAFFMGLLFPIREFTKSDWCFLLEIQK